VSAATFRLAHLAASERVGWPPRSAQQFRRARIKKMGSALGWLIGLGVAVVMWLLLVWVERILSDRKRRKNGG